MTKKEQFTVWYGNLKIDEVIAYFNLPSERINYESIQEILLENFDCKEYFPALNNILFLGLLEIEKIDTNKYLKFIEALLKNGFNSNYCDVEGNNIIQAAMKSGCSTEFIVNLINLTKKYNLNVDARDKHGNSIVHTAIEARNYQGEIIPIVEALGKEFNFNCKDKKGIDLIAKFNMCKNQILKEINKTKELIEFLTNETELFSNPVLLSESQVELNIYQTYYDRLILEETDFKKTVIMFRKLDGILSKVDRKKKEKVSKQIQNKNSLVLEVNDISAKLNFDFIIANKSRIDYLTNKLITAINNEKTPSYEKRIIIEKLKDFNKLVQEIFTKEMETLQSSNDINYLANVETRLKDAGYSEQQLVVRKTIEDYQDKVKSLANSIDYNLTLKSISEIEEKINTLDSKNRKKLSEVLETKKIKILERFERFNKLQSTAASFGLEKVSSKEYSEYDLAKLNQMIVKIEKEISIRRNIINLKLQQSFSGIFTSTSLRLLKVEQESSNCENKNDLIRKREMKEVIESYKSIISTLKDKIENNLTLNGTLEYKDIINTLDDKNKKELLLMLETKKNKLEALKNHLMVSFELKSLSFITLQGICYESNMAELSKIIERIENEKFLGQTAKSIELNREFSDVLTESALKLLGQGRFWREVSTGENQSFSSQKVKIKKK